MSNSYVQRPCADAKIYPLVSCPAAYSSTTSLGHTLHSAWPATYGAAYPLDHPASERQVARPLRIAHLGPCFIQGGAEQQAIDLAGALDPSRARIEKFLVTNQELISRAKVAQMPLPVEVADADVIRQAAQEYDIVLFWGLELDPLLSGIPRTARTVCIAHGVGDWVNGLLAGSRQSTDHVVAVSDRVRTSLGIPLPVTTIPNGIDARRIAASRSRCDVRQSLGFAPTDFVTGFVGRFSPEKHPELLIEAMSRLAAPHKLLLVGYGALEYDLMRLANGRIPGRYAFAFAEDYLGDYYHAMDCFCLPSRTEGFALVLLEAMLSGVPVVSTDVGGARELIRHLQTGVIVEADPDHVAAALHDVAARPHWARGMAAEAAEQADLVGHASLMARRYEELFVRLCGNNAPHDPVGSTAPTYGSHAPPAPPVAKTEPAEGCKYAGS